MQSPPNAPVFPPHDVLVVEDNHLIALDTENLLLEIGVQHVRIVNSVAHALQAIAESRPDYCLLDVQLGDQSSYVVADMLLKLDIPFSFATGYGDNYAFPPLYVDAHILGKPYSLEAIRAALLRSGGGPSK